MIALFLLVWHLIICVILYLLIRLSILKCPKTIMPMVFLVPVWGIFVMLLLEFRTRDKKPENKEVGIEKLKVKDFVHRSILVTENPVEERIVPLEEALLINNPGTRRQLMMEIMYDDPNDYVNLLKEARMNDDTEVVHYAVTALTELQKEYDLQFQELDWKIEQDPDNDGLLDKYFRLLKQYLSSGIAEGNDRKLKLSTYSDILDKKIKAEPERLEYRKEKVQVDLKTENYTGMYQDITYIIRHWPANEAGYLLMMQYFSLVKNREGMRRVMELIERKQIYLTPDGRRQIKFWQNEEGVAKV